MASKNDKASSQLNSDSEKHQPGRRKFVKGAAAAAPIILTVTSRPAMGGNFCTPSGFLSGNLSNPDDQMPCNGRSPGYWKTHFPSQYEGVRFAQVFGGVWMDGSGQPWSAGVTLKQVLRFKGHEDRYEFGFHAVAAYFNAEYRERLHFPMTTDTVIDMVQQILMFGLYTEPTTQMSMDAVEVKNFFESTYH